MLKLSYIEKVHPERDKEKKEIREKVLLLANGMIDVHGFKRDEAFEKALSIARKWLTDGGDLITD